MPSFTRPTSQSCTGLWETSNKIDGTGLTFSTDASGGPFTSDPRLRRVGVSVIGFKWVDGEPIEVASICATLAGQQSVYRGELFAVLLLLQHVEGQIDCTLERLGVHKKLSGKCDGKFHADLC